MKTHAKRKVRAWCWAASLVSAFALIGGCGDQTTDDTAAADAARAGVSSYSPIGAQGLNVILVSVDTTRADHLGCYGHPAINTPSIDRFADEGTRFAQAISSSPLTLPSHTTMLTGSYPFVHGARDNGLFVVAEENITLAELFADAGYATHAEVAAIVLGSKYGLDQGFRSYGEAHPPERDVEIVAVPPVGGDPALDGALGEIEVKAPAIELDRKADEITRRGIELLTEKAANNEQFFLFLHYFDPHWPHEAPEPFASRYREGYFAEIAYFDQEFGKLVDAVRDLGLAEDTLVILTSDHGEGRGQHGEHTHSNFLYDTTQHVPLILWSPGRIPGGQVVENQVRLIDLAPTIADFARLETTEQMQGTSLLPLVSEPNREYRLPAYADTLVPRHSFNYSPLRALRADGWKYILAPRPELYELSDDPGELFNLVNVEPDRAARMKAELRGIIAGSPPSVAGGAMQSLDQEELRKLASLGYVNPTGLQNGDTSLDHELDQFEPEGVNPKDRVELVELWATGLGALRVGGWEDAVRIFTRFMELEPELVAGPRYLGRALTMLDRNDEAIAALQRAIELDPGSFHDLRSLGNLFALRGDYAGAMEAYRETVRLNSEEIIAHLNLGILLMAEQQHSAALEQFDQALKEAPQDSVLHLQRAISLRLGGRFHDAVMALGEAIALNPLLVQAHAELAIVRHELGQTDLAVSGLGQALADMPGQAVLHHQMAGLQSAIDELDAAGENFAQVVALIPDNAVAHQNLGLNLLMRGAPGEAIGRLREALALNHDLPDARFYLGNALADAGALPEALRTYRELLDAYPAYVSAYSSASELLAREGGEAEAINLLRSGLERAPGNAVLLNDLAWYLATSSDAAVRDGDEAVRLAEQAVALSPESSFNELDTLAVAYARAGRFEDAIATAEQALALIRQQGLADLEVSVSQRLALFRRRQPYPGP